MLRYQASQLQTPFPILFLFFFLFRPTDPKSQNAFDNKRKKREIALQGFLKSRKWSARKSLFDSVEVIVENIGPVLSFGSLWVKLKGGQNWLEKNSEANIFQFLPKLCPSNNVELSFMKSLLTKIIQCIRRRRRCRQINLSLNWFTGRRKKKHASRLFVFGVILWRAIRPWWS